MRERKIYTALRNNVDRVSKPIVICIFFEVLAMAEAGLSRMRTSHYSGT